MLIFLLLLAFVLAVVAGIGLFVEKSRWLALLAFAVAAWVLVDLWPHLGIR